VKKNIALSIKKAFTLIELLIVVAIIGILAGVGIPMYNGYIEQSKYNSIAANFKIVAENTSILLLDCDLKGAITVLANDGGNGELRTFICRDENTNSIANLFIDHFHYRGFTNPATGESELGALENVQIKKKMVTFFLMAIQLMSVLSKLLLQGLIPEHSREKTFLKILI
jgi:prepilin-type N-terminal cleavage/methylation domain-containing protein